MRHALESYKASDPTHVRITHVSPLVSCTPRLLYTNVLQQLKSDAEACSDASSFLKAARVLAKPISKWVIAVYDSERIRDIWPEHISEMWPLLAEMMGCQGKVMVVFVSPLSWASFRSTSGRTMSTSPLCIRIPRLPRDDVLALLDQDAETALTHVPDGIDFGLYRVVCQVFYDTVKDTIRDEYEIRILYTHLWRKLMSVVHAKGVRPNMPSLMPHISELCRDALARVAPRHVGPSAWDLDSNVTKPESALMALPSRTGFGVMQAFLLISAFLASYNPAITDVKYFVRELKVSRKRRRGKAQKAAQEALMEMEGMTEIFDRTQFWGPRPFTLERVLAMYHALLADFELDLNEDGLLAPAERAARTSDNKAELNLEHVAGEFWSRSSTALAELNELVRQQLIVRISPANKLGAMQYRVNASFEYVYQVAVAVGFPLRVWLWDTYT